MAAAGRAVLAAPPNPPSGCSGRWPSVTGSYPPPGSPPRAASVCPKRCRRIPLTATRAPRGTQPAKDFTASRRSGLAGAEQRLRLRIGDSGLPWPVRLAYLAGDRALKRLVNVISFLRSTSPKHSARRRPLPPPGGFGERGGRAGKEAGMTPAQRLMCRRIRKAMAEFYVDPGNERRFSQWRSSRRSGGVAAGKHVTRPVTVHMRTVPILGRVPRRDHGVHRRHGTDRGALMAALTRPWRRGGRGGAGMLTAGRPGTRAPERAAKQTRSHTIRAVQSI